MPQNVEIKAKLTDEQFASAKTIAARLSNNDSQSLCQLDTFYKVSNGRLKLREFLNAETGEETDNENATAELIQYSRPDRPGPKLSSYRRIPVSNDELVAALTDALTVIGTVKKHRTVYFVDQTRVHLDQVKGLGPFLELEVVLQGNQTPEFGEQLAARLMKDLKIENASLVSGAYIDLLENGCFSN